MKSIDSDSAAFLPLARGRQLAAELPGTIPTPAPYSREGCEPGTCTATLSARAPGHASITQLQQMGATAPLTDQTRPWFIGAMGEIAVGTELLRLGPEWLVLHSVPVGSGASDIDHVLVGPPGVFTIATKHHRDKDVWVGQHVLAVAGQRTPYLRNAWLEAERAGARLSAVLGAPVPVQPLVVLAGVRGLTVASSSEVVPVLRAQEVARWLKAQPPRLTRERLSRLQAVAEIPGTWHDRPTPFQDGAPVLAWYRRLESAVESCRHRVSRAGGREPAAAESRARSDRRRGRPRRGRIERAGPTASGAIVAGAMVIGFLLALLAVG